MPHHQGCMYDAYLTWEAILNGVLVLELASANQDVLRQPSLMINIANRNSSKALDKRATLGIQRLLLHSTACAVCILVVPNCKEGGVPTTPMASRDRFRLLWMVLAKFFAWSAMGCLSYVTLPTCILSSQHAIANFPPPCPPRIRSGHHP